MEQWLQLIVSALLGGVVNLVGDRVRQHWNRPILAVSFINGPDCITRTPVYSNRNNAEIYLDEGIWVRVRVENRGRSSARNCRAFMTSFHFESLDRTKIVFNNQDAIQLKWSLTAGIDEIDLPQFINQFVDICQSPFGKELSGISRLRIPRVARP